MRYTLLLAGLLAMLFAPISARAAESIVINHTGLRAGPGTGYPLLMRLPKGAAVDVLGCVAGWKWCEVVAGGVHGWAVGHRLSLPFGSRGGVQVDLYGPKLGLPIIVFQEQPYWERYYYNRDFYIVRYGHHTVHCHDPDHDADCHPIYEMHDHDHHDHWYDSHHTTLQYDDADHHHDWHNDDHWHYNN